jgi:hypothetical protein
MDMSLETLPISKLYAEIDMAIETLPVPGMNAEVNMALSRCQYLYSMQRWTPL